VPYLRSGSNATGRSWACLSEIRLCEGLRTPAPVCAAPPSWGRHPQTFTKPEVPPLHSMTSSAVTSSEDGTVRLRALAVFKLITSLKRVGCSIGRSPGFAPLSILSA
jgi:hypothetical protein